MHKAKRMKVVPALEPALRDAVRNAIRDEGGEAAVVRGAMRSGRSTCFFLDHPQERLVLKVYDKSFNSSEEILAQYSAMQLLWSRAHSDPAVAVPRPIAIFEELGAVLMSFVEGTSIDEFMGRGLYPSVGLDVLAATIISGLRLYHEALGGPFGDCYVGNFLVRSTTQIGMLDPQIPDLHATPIESGYEWLAVDLGYWSAAVALAVPLELRTSGRLPFNRLRLTLRMVDQATHTLSPPDRDAFRKRTYALANAQLPRWINERTLAGRTKGALTRAILHSMQSTNEGRADSTNKG